METTIKIVVIFVVLIIYTMTMKSCLENFTVQAHNTVAMLSNKSSSLRDRHPIYSLPIEQKIDNVDKYYYEYDNTTYSSIIKQVFINDIMTNNEQDRINESMKKQEWISDIDADITGRYNKVFQHINNKLNEHNPDIQIVHDVLNRYKKDIENDIYILDIDMILYRENKLNGKHINFLVFYSYTDTNVLDISIKGIVGEQDIVMHPIEPSQKIDLPYQNYSSSYVYNN